jgi:hypothetical protein
LSSTCWSSFWRNLPYWEGEGCGNRSAEGETLERVTEGCSRPEIERINQSIRYLMEIINQDPERVPDGERSRRVRPGAY